MVKSIVSLIILGLVLLAGQLDKVGTLNLSGTAVKVPHVESALCRDPREHVYNPDRLTLIDPCIQVTGTVEVIRNEPDGDYHILLKLDQEFADLINDGNVKGERGDLVLETVCEHTVTQADAVSSCQGVAPSVPKPQVGERVVVIGPYVLDTEHSNWAEIHPAWEINSL